MNPKSVIVFGAHPDDIEIGMGGTIRKLASAGNDIYSCITSIPDSHERRKLEAREAAVILGIKDVLFLNFELADLGFNRKTINAIDNIINVLKPHSVFTHWIEDSHQDHANTTRCVIAATRKNEFNVLMYEQTLPGGITPAAFRAQYFIDITPHIDAKIESIRAHKSQMEKNGDWWLEGIRGRAMYRGYQIRSKFAEAFEIIKMKENIDLF